MNKLLLLLAIGILATAFADEVVIGTAGGPPSSYPLCGS